MTDIPHVNMVAVVGQQGFIGCSGELPQFNDPAFAQAFQAWVMSLTMGGVMVIGGRSYGYLLERGFPGFEPTSAWKVAVWNRAAQRENDPVTFLRRNAHPNRPVFVMGGAYTFRCFLPYVRQFFIRRTVLLGPLDVQMPDLFGRAH